MTCFPPVRHGSSTYEQPLEGECFDVFSVVLSSVGLTVLTPERTSRAYCAPFPCNTETVDATGVSVTGRG